MSPPKNLDLNVSCHTAALSQDHEVAYYTYRSSSPQPMATLLFAHAASFHGRVWDQIIQHLTDDFNCISFDFFGHGKSSGSASNNPSDTVTWEALFGDIPRLIDQLDIEGLLFGVGHSLGGASLLHACQKNLDAVWAYEPVVFKDLAAFGGVVTAMAQRAEKRRSTFDTAAQARAWLVERPPFDTVQPAVLEDYLNHGLVEHPVGVQLSCPPTLEAAVYRNGTELDLFGAVTDIEVPVHVAVGGQDPSAEKLGSELTSALPSGNLEVFKQCSHLGPLEAPELIAASIRRFFFSAL